MGVLSSLESHVSRSPEKTALGFFDKVGPDHLHVLTYQALLQRSQAVAAHLVHLGVLPGQRVLIVLPQSLDYVVAFLGCLYAGLIAVPLSQPRGPNHVDRIMAVVADADASAVISNQAFLETLTATKIQQTNASLRFIDNAKIGIVPSSPIRCSQSDSDAPAYLQYSSGSTGTPKGIVVSHRNLAVNCDIQAQLFHTGPASIVVSWLPLSHDMGLIGGVLSSLYFGGTTYLTTPLNFLRQPKIWLDAMTWFRGTQSWAPNFAYDLCVEKIPEENRGDLDLSHWEVAVNASEPVRPKTMAAFVAAYQPHGLNPRSMKAAFGLAEATLVVTGIGVTRAFYKETIDAVHCQTQNSALPAQNGALMTVSYASNGRPIDDTQVCIVGTDQAVLPARHIGEVWVRGPHVCSGYWGKPELSSDVFCAFTTEGNGPYLRTGDLGYLNENGDLFIVGRLKDVIVIRGKNYAAADIEHTLETSIPAIQPGFCAAIAVDQADREQLVILIDMRQSFHQVDYPFLCSLIQSRLRLDHGIEADRVVLVGRGGLSKTTSGKHQRYLYKQQYLSGTLKTIQMPPSSEGTL